MVKVIATVAGGLILAAFIAGGGAFVTVSLLSHRADASEQKIDELDVRADVLERNQVSLDLHTRVQQQELSWMQSKIDALLRRSDVPIPVKPPLPESVLELPR
jgi:hypothetical protein